MTPSRPRSQLYLAQNPGNCRSRSVISMALTNLSRCSRPGSTSPWTSVFRGQRCFVSDLSDVGYLLIRVFRRRATGIWFLLFSLARLRSAGGSLETAPCPGSAPNLCRHNCFGCYRDASPAVPGSPRTYTSENNHCRDLENFLWSFNNARPVRPAASTLLLHATLQ